MQKITRRFFGGSVLALFALPWLRLGSKVDGVRHRASDLLLRFRRWRFGIQPRWIEMSSIEFYREGTGFEPRPHKVTRRWRELRWPDNDELVRSETLGAWPDDPRASVELLDMDGPVEWHHNELGCRVPGPRSASLQELFAKVRRAAELPLEEHRHRRGDSEAIRRNTWIGQAREMVRKMDRDPRFNSAADAHAFAELEAGAVPVIRRVQERAGPGSRVTQAWDIFKLGRFEA